MEKPNNSNQADESETVPDSSTKIPHPSTKKRTGIARIIKAGGYSLSGLRLAFKGEAAFRQECVLALIAVPVAFLLPVSMNSRVLLIASTILVLIVELLNSAVEAVVDRVGLEAHPLSGQAKDIGSAAVLLALLLWGYVWLEVLLSLL